MSLREAVKAIQTRQVGGIPARFYRPRTALAGVIDRLGHIETSVAVPKQSLADAVVGRVAHCLATHSCASLARRDWRIVPWVMWQKPNAADHEWFLEALFAMIVADRPLSVIKALTHAYVANFDAKRPSCVHVAHFLRSGGLSQAETFGSRWLAIGRRFSIFDPDKAPIVIGSYVATCSDMLLGLEEAGMTRERIDDPLARQSFSYAVEAVAEHVRKAWAAQTTRHALEQLFLWNAVEGRTIRYAPCMNDMATSLLEALSNPAIAQELGDLIVQYFIKTLGDPRLDQSRWNGVSTNALEIAMALLVKTTLEDFFRVIDATVLDKYMWNERKEFWLAYWQKGTISHAWVAFGPRAVSRAVSLGRKYGQFNGGTEKTQSALIVRIDNLTIVEISHNGRCLLFPDTRAARPANYDLSYNVVTMRKQCAESGEALTHMGDWRPRFAAAIFRYTGIRHASYGAGY